MVWGPRWGQHGAENMCGKSVKPKRKSRDAKVDEMKRERLALVQMTAVRQRESDKALDRPGRPRLRKRVLRAGLLVHEVDRAGEALDQVLLRSPEDVSRGGAIGKKEGKTYRSAVNKQWANAWALAPSGARPRRSHGGM